MNNIVLGTQLDRYFRPNPNPLTDYIFLEINEDLFMVLDDLKLEEIDAVANRLRNEIDQAKTARLKNEVTQRYARFIAAAALIKPLLAQHRNWTWRRAVRHIERHHPELLEGLERAHT